MKNIEQKCVTGLILLMSCCATAVATETPAAARAQVGFGAPLADSRIIQVFERSGVKPTAVQFWAGGLTGTHRAYSSAGGARPFVAQARHAAIDFMRHALQSNNSQILAFLDANPDVAPAGSDAAVQAASLLLLRQQLLAAHRAALRDEPLIFAAEVHGPGASIDDLKRSPEVAVFLENDQRDVGKLRAGVEALKPTEFGIAASSNAHNAANPLELWQRLALAVGRSGP